MAGSRKHGNHDLIRLAEQVATAAVTMAVARCSPVQILANNTKVVIMLPTDQDHTGSPDYVGAYGPDGFDAAREDLLDRWLPGVTVNEEATKPVGSAAAAKAHTPRRNAALARRERWDRTWGERGGGYEIEGERFDTIKQVWQSVTARGHDINYNAVQMRLRQGDRTWERLTRPVMDRKAARGLGAQAIRASDRSRGGHFIVEGAVYASGRRVFLAAKEKGFVGSEGVINDRLRRGDSTWDRLCRPIMPMHQRAANALARKRAAGLAEAQEASRKVAERKAVQQQAEGVV